MNDLKSESVPENRKGFTINASPLNPVKLELGVFVIIGVFLLIVMEFLTESLMIQFLALGVFGIVMMVWLGLRVRQVMKTHREEKHG